jgi:hypothetical protein
MKTGGFMNARRTVMHSVALLILVSTCLLLSGCLIIGGDHFLWF